MGRIPETPGPRDGQITQTAGELASTQPQTRTGRVIGWLERQAIIFDNDIFNQIAERVRTGFDQIRNLYLETYGYITQDGRVNPYDGRNAPSSGIRVHVGPDTMEALSLEYRKDTDPEILIDKNKKHLIKRGRHISVKRTVRRDGKLEQQNWDSHRTAVASVFKTLYVEPENDVLRALATDLVAPEDIAIKTLADIVDEYRASKEAQKTS